MDSEFYRSGEGEKETGRGGNAFATIVIIIVILLLALLVIGLFWPQVFGGEAPTVSQKTAAPSATPTLPAELPQETLPPVVPEDEPTEKPQQTPAVEDEDRDMPALDGLTPTVPFLTENPIPAIYEAVSPGVVGVVNYIKAEPSKSGKERFEIFGSGTGFAVSSEGYVLTNAHVVDGADKVTVMVDGDENEYEAVVIGADMETDVAVLKVEGKTLQPLSLGDSEAVRVGEYALAIGNPLSADELANTITLGIISATSREITIDSYTNTYLQTDAAINFGNSGGPLLNMQGEVIGMNSAKTITAGYDALGNAVSAEGIGFALPINQVKRIMEILVTVGHIERPGIGVTVSTIDENAAEELGCPVGALVQSVVKGQPADVAGVKANDIIVEANGKTIEDHNKLVDIVRDQMIGDELALRIWRDGQYLDITLILSNKTDMDFSDIAGGE